MPVNSAVDDDENPVPRLPSLERLFHGNGDVFRRSSDVLIGYGEVFIGSSDIFMGSSDIFMGSNDAFTTSFNILDIRKTSSRVKLLSRQLDQSKCLPLHLLSFSRFR